jgi:uncharacterized protein
LPKPPGSAILRQMRPRSLTPPSLLAAMALTAAACEPGGAAGQVMPKSPTYAEATGADEGSAGGSRCAAPYVVDARPEQRMAIEVAMKGGLAVVAYDCEALRVIADCHLDGEYGFMGTTPKRGSPRRARN